MLCDYTQLNFLGLKVIFEQFNHLSAITGISNIGVKAFRSIFESPNSDINYVLQLILSNLYEGAQLSKETQLY